MPTIIDVALLTVRLVLGTVFVIHGGQKLFSWMGGSGVKGTAEGMGRSGAAPALRYPLAWMATLSEFGGGLLVLLGLLTPLAGALIISVMLVAIWTVHFKNGWLNGNRGYEFNLSLIALALVLILLGAGGLSLDHVLGLATTVDRDPAYIQVILLLVMFGGVATMQLARMLNHTHPEDQSTQAAKSK